MQRTIFAVALLILQAWPVAAAPAPAVSVDTETITITAPRVESPKTALKTTRRAGTALAAGGLGGLAYVTLAAGGPIVWAAAAVWIGGVSAYLSHRRLRGHDDFGPGYLKGGRSAARGEPRSAR